MSLGVTVGGVLLAVGAASAWASQAVLDHATITGHAGGTSNSTGFFPVIDRLLELPAGSTVERFELELSSFTSNIGPPVGLEIAFQWSVTSTGTALFRNDGAPLEPGLTVIRWPWEPGFAHMLGLTSQGTQVPTLLGTVGWPVGGLAIDFGVTLDFRAVGTLAPVAVGRTTWSGIRALYR